MSEITFGICGNLDHHSTDPDDNPFTALKKDRVKESILKLNRCPVEEETLFSEYGDIEQDINKLIRLGALRIKDGKVHVNFTFLDEMDNRLIFEICEDHTGYLVEKLLSKKDDIYNILSRYENQRVEKDKLAFFIIGCYFLDWGSLTMFRRWGIADNLKPQAGGNEYTLWGEKQDTGMLKEIYWGGHMIPDIDYIFHTFGDHHTYTKRETLPDILHVFHDFDLPGGKEYRSLLFDKRKELALELGDIINEIGKDGSSVEYMSEFSCSEDHLSFLMKMGYIEEEHGMYYLSIPYFTEDDLKMIEDCITPLIPILKEWLEESLDKLKLDLEDTRPMKNGVPFDEFFIQVWHIIFGSVNKELARQGLIYDTYSDDSKYNGYLPAIAKKELMGALEKIV